MLPPDEQDHDDQEVSGIEEPSPLPKMQHKGSEGSGYSDRTSMGGKSELSQEEMINITSCDFTEFSAYMSQQYGAAQFTEGYQIVSKKQDLIYMDDGEEQLIRTLSHLFPEREACRGFINFCTTYLIVQNMQFGN